MTVRLENSERLHRFLVEQSPDIIYTLDKKGHFIFVNGRVHGLLGYTREELLGKHYSLIVHPDDLEHARFAFNERRIGDRASTNVEIRLQTKTQRVRHFENRTIVTILSAQGLYAAADGPATRTSWAPRASPATSPTARRPRRPLLSRPFTICSPDSRTASCSRIDWRLR
jgi:PAS domain S-box-containing protein